MLNDDEFIDQDHKWQQKNKEHSARNIMQVINVTCYDNDMTTW